MIPSFAAMPLEDVLELPLQRPSRKRAIDEIRPIERADELDGIVQRELTRNIAPDARRCRRGVRVKADAGQQLPQPSKLTVFGPEVVSPLADAVRFVHRDEPDAARREQGEEAFAPFADQPLGRHIEQAVPSRAKPGDDSALLIGGERAVIERGRDAVADQRVHLILHQRDER